MFFKLATLRIVAICTFWLCISTTHAFAGSMSVTFINPGKTGEVFWDAVSETMKAAAQDLDIDLEILSAERNRFRMRELGLEVAKRPVQPDYLVLVNEDQFIGDVVRAADSVGIKTFLLLNDLVGDEMKEMGKPRQKLQNWIGSLVPDNEGAGYRMAKGIIKAARADGLIDSNGKVHMLAIGGDEVTPASLERLNGLQRALSEDPDVVLDRLLFANWNKQEAKQLAGRYAEWAKRNQITVGAVWAANDPIALGVIEAFDEAGLEPKKDYVVVGLNWSREALQAVVAQRMFCTDGGHFLAGGWAMVLLRNHFDGWDFAQDSSRLKFPMAGLSHSRAAEYLAVLGDGDWGKINYKKFQEMGRQGDPTKQLTMQQVLKSLE